jgi:hypothetical protein
MRGFKRPYFNGAALERGNLKLQDGRGFAASAIPFRSGLNPTGRRGSGVDSYCTKESHRESYTAFGMIFSGIAK